VWTVPAERFKAGQQHRLPLTPDMLALLKQLPRWRRGDCVFSVTFGTSPVISWAKVKARLDHRMLRSLRALALLRGDDPASVALPPFVNHDLRRTVRTRLSALRVPEHIAEACIGHGRRGIARVYDMNRFEVEIREALTKWQALLGRIVRGDTDDNVVELRTGEA